MSQRQTKFFNATGIGSIIILHLILYSAIYVWFGASGLLSLASNYDLRGSHAEGVLKAFISTQFQMFLAYTLIAVLMSSGPIAFRRQLAKLSRVYQAIVLLLYNLAIVLFFSVRFAIYKPGLVEDFIRRKSFPITFTLHKIIVSVVSLERLNQAGCAVLVFAAVLLLALNRKQILALLQNRVIQRSLAITGVFVFIVMLAGPLKRAIFGRTPEQPNVLILGIDSLRPDHLSFNGYKRKTSPNLDVLLSESVIFNRTYVSIARTAPSWTSILTGTYPSAHGIHHMFPPRTERAVFVPTLVDSFKQKGYFTSVISDYAGEMFKFIDFKFDKTETPLGFSVASIVAQETALLHYLPFAFFSAKTLRSFSSATNDFANNADPFVLSERIADEVEERQNSKRPFFIVGFFSSVHAPYTLVHPYYNTYSKSSYKGENRFAYSVRDISQLDKVGEKVTSDDEKDQVVALYDQAVNETDVAIGSLIEKLRRKKTLDNTIIVILSDHGEYLYEESHLMGHGVWLGRLEPDTRMFLSIRVPKHLSSALPQKVESITRSIDIAPTLLDLVRGDIPASMQGTALLNEKNLKQGAVNLSPLEAYIETDISLNADKEWKGIESIKYPNIKQLLAPESGYPGYLVLKPEFRYLVRQAKWRMLVSSEGRLLYIPTPKGAQYTVFPTSPGIDQSKLKHNLKASLKRHMILEPASYLDSGDLLGYFTN